MSSEWLDDGDKRTEIIGGWQLKMLPRHSGEQFVSQPLNPILMYGKMKAIFHFNGRHYPDPLVGHEVAFLSLWPSPSKKKATQPPAVVKKKPRNVAAATRRINMAAAASTAAAVAVRPAQIDTQSMD